MAAQLRSLEKNKQTEIETEMLVIHPILNKNLDNIHLMMNGQTQKQLSKELFEGS